MKLLCLIGLLFLGCGHESEATVTAPEPVARISMASWSSEMCPDGTYALISQPFERFWMSPPDWKCMYICNGDTSATDPLLAATEAECDARVQATVTCPCP